MYFFSPVGIYVAKMAKQFVKKLKSQSSPLSYDKNSLFKQSDVSKSLHFGKVVDFLTSLSTDLLVVCRQVLSGRDEN